MNSLMSGDTIAYHLGDIGSKQIFTKTGSYKVMFTLLLARRSLLIIASVSANGVDLSPIPTVGICVSVCPESVLWQNG